MTKAHLQYSDTINAVFHSFFPVTGKESRDQDKSWSDWVKMRQGCGYNRLLELLQSDVKDVFKARVIAILLAPNLELLPFEFPESSKTERNNNFLYENDFKISELSAELVLFTISLLKGNINFVLAQKRRERTGRERTERILKTLSEYNSRVLDALILYHEDSPKAEAVFNLFQMDVEYHCSGSEGYGPLIMILAREVPEKWKRLTDAKVRELIHKELRRKNKPKSWDSVCWKYVESIYWTTKRIEYGESFCHSKELLASQVEFVLSLSEPIPLSFRDREVENIMALLQGEKYKKIRHMLTRNVVLGGKKDDALFGLCVGVNEELLAKMLFEFGEEDKQLETKLKTLITERVKDASSYRQKEKAKQKKADGITAAMK